MDIIKCSLCREGVANHYVPTTGDFICVGCFKKAIDGFIKKAQEFDWTNFKPVIYDEVVKKYGNPWIK